MRNKNKRKSLKDITSNIVILQIKGPFIFDARRSAIMAPLFCRVYNINSMSEIHINAGKVKRLTCLWNILQEMDLVFFFKKKNHNS